MTRSVKTVEIFHPPCQNFLIEKFDKEKSLPAGRGGFFIFYFSFYFFLFYSFSLFSSFCFSFRFFLCLL